MPRANNTFSWFFSATVAYCWCPRAVGLSLAVLMIHREVPLLCSSLPTVGTLFMKYCFLPWKGSLGSDVFTSAERDWWEAVISGIIPALDFFVWSRLDRESKVVSALAGDRHVAVPSLRSVFSFEGCHASSMLNSGIMHSAGCYQVLNLCSSSSCQLASIALPSGSGELSIMTVLCHLSQPYQQGLFASICINP